MQADEVEAVMAATRVLVALSARSIAGLDGRITLPQFRVLVMVASTGPVNLGAVARALGVHPSNATRACDRLVTAGLLDRRDDPDDRRNLALELTGAGRALVDQVMDDRRAAITEVLERMPDEQRQALAPVLASFAAAGGEMPAADVWALGWTTSTDGQEAS